MITLGAPSLAPLGRGFSVSDEICGAQASLIVISFWYQNIDSLETTGHHCARRVSRVSQMRAPDKREQLVRAQHPESSRGVAEPLERRSAFKNARAFGL